MSTMPAGQLAHFDQAYAEVAQRLDVIIDTYRSANPGPREIGLAGLAEWLVQNSDLESLASFLVVAIDRLIANEAPPT